MNIEEVREQCFVKPGVTEGFPFDETSLVFKVMNKKKGREVRKKKKTFARILHSVPDRIRWLHG